MISGKFTADEEVEVAQTIQQLVSQIKTHIGYLSTKSKRFADDYSENFDKLKEVTAEMHTSLILPLALAMEQVENYSDETFRLKSTNEDQELKRALRTIINTKEFDIKNDTVDAFFDYVYAKSVVVKGYFNKPLPYKEKVISIMLGYSKEDWEALKKIDPKGTDDLMKATEEIISAFGVPLTVGDLGLILITPIIKTVKVLSKISSTVLAKGAPADKARILKSFQGTITKAKEKLTYWFGKYFPKGCLDDILTISSFHTQAKAPCPTFLGKVLDIEKIIIKHANDLKIHHPFMSSEFLNKGKFADKAIKAKKEFSNIKKLDPLLKKLTSEEKIFYESIEEIYSIFKTQKGIPIKKIKNYDLYFPDFSNLSSVSVKFSESLSTTGKKLTMKGGNLDYLASDEMAVTLFKNKGFISKNLTLDEAKKEVTRLRSKFKLTWHHNEDLDLMELVPAGIHFGLDHVGAESIIKKIESKFKTQWRNIIKKTE